MMTVRLLALGILMCFDWTHEVPSSDILQSNGCTHPQGTHGGIPTYHLALYIIRQMQAKKTKLFLKIFHLFLVLWAEIMPYKSQERDFKQQILKKNYSVTILNKQTNKQFSLL